MSLVQFYCDGIFEIINFGIFWISYGRIIQQFVLEFRDVLYFYVKLNTIFDVLLQYFLGDVRPVGLRHSVIVVDIHNLHIDGGELFSNCFHELQWLNIQSQHYHLPDFITIQVFQ